VFSRPSVFRGTDFAHNFRVPRSVSNKSDDLLRSLLEIAISVEIVSQLTPPIERPVPAFDLMDQKAFTVERGSAKGEQQLCPDVLAGLVW